MTDSESTTFFQMPGSRPKAAVGPKLDTAYHAISGRDIDDCVFLSQRFEEDLGFRPWDSESWVIATERAAPEDINQLRFNLHLGTQGWFTDIWRSPSGAVFVSEVSGRIYRNADLSAPDARGAWDLDLLLCTAHGVWGLHDQAVFIWGTHQQRPALHQWNGTAWSEHPAPPFPISTMHGVSESEIWASGQRGGLARWDGADWRVYPTRTTEDLLALHVVSEDEVYVGGNMATVFEGSRHGIFLVGSIPDSMQGDLQDLAYWNGQLWAACGPIGLFKRVDQSHEFELVDGALDGYQFDCREDALVVVVGEEISSTTDGINFRRAGLNALVNLRAGAALGDM